MPRRSQLLAMLFCRFLPFIEDCSEVWHSLFDSRIALTLSICSLLVTLIAPCAQATQTSAFLEPDHVHLDANITASYGNQEPVGSKQSRFASLWSLSKILLMTRGAINDTYSEDLGEHVYIKNFTMSLMIDSARTSIILGYDIYGVVERNFILGGTSFKVDCRWRYISIDKRYPVRGEIWVNLSQSLFLNFSCFSTDLTDWKETTVGSRTIVFQNVSSFQIPYVAGSRVYKVKVDPSMQIATPPNSHDISQAKDHISFSLAILPEAYILTTIVLLVIVLTVSLHPKLRRWWKAQLSEQKTTRSLTT